MNTWIIVLAGMAGAFVGLAIARRLPRKLPPARRHLLSVALAMATGCALALLALACF